MDIKHIGQAIAFYAKQKQISYRKISRDTDVSFPTVLRLVHKPEIVKLETLCIVAEYLELDVSILPKQPAIEV